MSANILQSYLIKLGTSVDRKGLDGFVGAVTSGISTLAKFGAATVGAFGGVQAWIMKLASSEDAVGDFAERVGVSVENIKRLGYVATLSGSSTGAMQNALENLSSMAGRAAMGMEGAERIFKDIGLNIRNSNGDIKSATELLDGLGQVLAGMDRNSQIAALDRLGIDRSLLQALTTDVSGLKAEFNSLADAAGVDFEKTKNAASVLSNEIDRTTTFIGLAAQVLGTDLMGETAELLRRLREWIREHAAEIRGFIGTAVKVIRAGAIVVGTILTRVGEGLAFLHEKTEGLSTAFAALVGIVALLGWPVALVAAGIAAVALLVDDLMTDLEGGKTLFDWSPWLDDIRAAGQWLEELAGKAKEELLVSLQEVRDWLDRIAESLGFKNLDSAIQTVIESLPGIVRELGNLVAYLGGSAWAIVKGAFSQVGDAIEALIIIIKNLSLFVINILTGDFSAAFKNIEGIVGAFVKYFGATFGRIGDLVGGFLGTIGDAIDKAKELLGLGGDESEAKEHAKAQKLSAAKKKLLPNDNAPRGLLNVSPPVPERAVWADMFKTPPVPSMGVMQDHRNAQGREAGKVELNQTNHIEITGMQNAQEIGQEVARSLNKVNRDTGDEYRYLVGAMG